MVQWREHSPPTNVARFRIPVLASYVEFVVGYVLVSSLRVFLRVPRFSSQHFQISMRPANSGKKSHFVDVTNIPIFPSFVLALMIG